MTVILLDGKVKATWVNAIASLAAPTAAELNGGTTLENLILPDGLNVTTQQNKGATGNLGSKWRTERMGSVGVDSSITYHHDSSSDTIHNLLVYGTNGYLVVRRGIAKTTNYVAGQKVEVYPMEAGEAQEVNPKPDGSWDAMVPLALTSEPQIRATVA